MCFCTAGFEMYALYAVLVVKALLRDGMVYVLRFSPWLNKLHTWSVMLDYILSPSMHACNMRAWNVCACVCVCVCVSV